MTETSPDDPRSKNKDFICGVVEGFYGRPWTTEQRKDLFQKLKKWGMDMYVYAPKDDYKHRAYWRELYTVEEAEHLTSLISAAKAQGITFCYALSPGLDITYSSQKEVTTLKRKLEQVSQFGCTCFALLFDDIEPEMTEADKQIFQSFAHAQVSITNEVHQHLGWPRFLVCPTQYCAARAAPSVVASEYLATLGSKLAQQIDVMWTGPMVISKTLTVECIVEITQVLRRPPVIWDNLHANDYDQKRIFLGPYCGRSPELIPLLRGVLTNPNCEYNCNLVAIHTLAHWARCSLTAPAHMEAVSWDIRLEREGESGVCEDDAPLVVEKHVYHHRQALKNAIEEWIPEFSIPKASQGSAIKPQPPIIVPPVPLMPLMPIVPSVNTCMSLTATTSSAATAGAIPTVSASHLATTVTVSAIETFSTVPNPVMNSLMSSSKVILNDTIPNPIIPIASSNISLPSELPISTLPVPILGIKSLEDNGDKIESDQSMSDKVDVNETSVNETVLEGASFEEIKKGKEDEVDPIIVDDVEPAIEVHQNGDMSVGATPQTLSPGRTWAEPLDVDPAPDSDIVMNDTASENGSMQVEVSNSPSSTDMMVEPVDVPFEAVSPGSADGRAPTADDLLLLCELFYLPFEHGARGLRLLADFNWLLEHADCLLPTGNKPETSEWRRRLGRFSWWVSRSRLAARRVLGASNRELCAELRPYLWDAAGVLALLAGLLRWLELGKFPADIATNIQGRYTWFSKGWREAFESGAQEPWMFRGGLTADLRRLLPVECAADTRPGPAGLPLALRPYAAPDLPAVAAICRMTCRDGEDGSELFPKDLQELPADRFVIPFLTLSPDMCMVLEDDGECAGDCEPDDDLAEDIGEPKVNGVKTEIVGYACAVVDAKDFFKRQEMALMPEMCGKYPAELLERDDLTEAAKECLISVRGGPAGPAPAPALLHAAALPHRDTHAPARLLTCLLAALRARGVSGVYSGVSATDERQLQLLARLGFAEAARLHNVVYMARNF